MSKKSNKVKFGLKNCHYAKATFDEDGSVTYAKPVRIPGAVSLSMDANGEIEPFYADNIAYYVVNNNSGYEGDLEIALIPESFLTDIMHEVPTPPMMSITSGTMRSTSRRRKLWTPKTPVTPRSRRAK